MTKFPHFIGGKRVEGKSGRFSDVFEPMTGEVRGQLALASRAEVRSAVENAKAAQPGLGRDQSAKTRARADEVPRARAQGI